MRILHTADWHLGNMMHNVDRTKEQEIFLDWLTGVVRDEGIEALIIAGDVFDTYGPPNWAQKIYYRFLASLLSTDCRNIVIVGGNHDSGRLLDAPRELLDALNIFVVGTIADKKPEDMVFELKDKNGEAAAVCAAVPFVPEILLNDYFPDRKECAPGTFSDSAYSVIYKACLEKAEELRDGRNIPLMATGHLYAAGLEGRYEGIQEEKKTDDGVRQMDVVGNLGKVHVNSFPEGFDYIALGHIHYQTRVDKREKVRYSGSPFVMGFDESNLDHYVLQVDLGEENDPHALHVTKIKTPQPISFQRVSGNPDEIKEQINKIIQKAEDSNEHEHYCIELYYNAEDAFALRTMVEDMKLPEHVSVVSWKVENSGVDFKTEIASCDIQNMSNLSPEVVVRQLVLSKVRIEKESLTDEEYAKRQEEEVRKYLPYFEEALDIAMKNR